MSRLQSPSIIETPIQGVESRGGYPQEREDDKKNLVQNLYLKHLHNITFYLFFVYAYVPIFCVYIHFCLVSDTDTCGQYSHIQHQRTIGRNF